VSAGHRRLAALIGVLLALAALAVGLLVGHGSGADAAGRPLVGAPAGTAFADATPGGKPARTLAGAAGTPLTWAIDGNTLIVATSPSGVAAARERGDRLTDTAGYRAVDGNVPNPIRSLVFLDPKQLLQLSAQSGIGPGAALQGIRGDLDRIRAIGAYGAGTGDVSTVELCLSIP